MLKYIVKFHFIILRLYKSYFEELQNLEYIKERSVLLSSTKDGLLDLHNNFIPILFNFIPIYLWKEIYQI